MAKPRRKGKPRSRATRDSTPSPAEAMRENLRRFTLKGWAVSAALLAQRRDRTAILDLMGFFDWLGDQNLATIKQALPRLPCKAGCAYCCYVGRDRPDLLPPELLRIAAYLSQDPGVLAQIQDRLQARGTDRDPKSPCLFLAEEQCTIYPVRPMRCRAQHSHDADACQRSYLGQRETMPLLSEPALLYKSLQMGIRLGLEEAGLQSTQLRLGKAMTIVLQEPESFERWLDGKPIFGNAVYPDPTDEQQHLVRFQRQAKYQAQHEKRTLQQVISTFLEKPGAWHRYTTSGIQPI